MAQDDTAASGAWLPPTGAEAVPERPSRYATPEPAGWWARVGATLLDTVIVFIGIFVVSFVGGLMVGVSGGKESDVAPVIVIPIIAVAVLYAPLMLAFNRGRTWGKQACGIRVVNRDYTPIGFGRALLREIPAKWLLSIIPLIDSLWPLWESENRALHDLAVATRVVDDD